jgi:cell division protein FtsW (lipid II flippase)
MTDDTSPRLQEFQSQVDDLRLTGGKANPERMAVRGAIALFVIAVALGLAAYFSSTGASDSRDQNEMIILGLVAVVIALGAAALFVRASLTRYFRYWLVRLVYEDRANTDRLIEAIKGDD